jgi:hypothetical protein
MLVSGLSRSLMLRKTYQRSRDEVVIPAVRFRREEAHIQSRRNEESSDHSENDGRVQEGGAEITSVDRWRGHRSEQKSAGSVARLKIREWTWRRARPVDMGSEQSAGMVFMFEGFSRRNPARHASATGGMRNRA